MHNIKSIITGEKTYKSVIPGWKATVDTRVNTCVKRVLVKAPHEY
jgi:hypothetical protein